MNANPEISLDDVLEELALTSAKPDARVLGEFTRRYPQYLDEIMEFAAELAALAMADEPGDGLEHSTTETSPAVSKAMSTLQNRLYEVKLEQGGQGAVSNPFASLTQQQLRSVANELHATPYFVIKLRDRTIAPETIPAGFRRLVSNVLKVPEPLVAAHFSAPAEIRAGMQFMSEQKPEAARQQTFVEAVKSSSLTEEQQQYLLSL